jgi:hypothetical protein
MFKTQFMIYIGEMKFSMSQTDKAELGTLFV